MILGWQGSEARLGCQGRVKGAPQSGLHQKSCATCNTMRRAMFTGEAQWEAMCQCEEAWQWHLANPPCKAKNSFAVLQNFYCIITLQKSSWIDRFIALISTREWRLPWSWYERLRAWNFNAPAATGSSCTSWTLAGSLGTKWLPCR